jgi:hypothetical protein
MIYECCKKKKMLWMKVLNNVKVEFMKMLKNIKSLMMKLFLNKNVCNNIKVFIMGIK